MGGVGRGVDMTKTFSEVLKGLIHILKIKIDFGDK